MYYKYNRLKLREVIMRKVLLTGGDGGIGVFIKQVFEEHGYEVIAPGLDELNYCDKDSFNAFLEKYKDEYFGVIINCAGVNNLNIIENVNDKDLDLMMTVNLIGPIKLLRAFFKRMKDNGYGRVVNIGSIWDTVSKSGRGIYAATKHGIHGITNTLAIEGGPYNVLVNTVSPGMTLTAMTSKNNTPEQIEAISKDIPMKRMAQPIEIARAVYFLGSEENTYITGQNLLVDGGYTIV